MIAQRTAGQPGADAWFSSRPLPHRLMARCDALGALKLPQVTITTAAAGGRRDIPARRAQCRRAAR